MTDFTFADIERVLDSESSIIVETSGSTGIPKRVRISAAALRASAQATAERIGEGQWVLALPTSYIAGIQVLVRSALAGTAPIALPLGRFRTRDFIAATAQLTGPGYVSLVPAQLRSLLGDPGGPEALAEYAAVLVGGQRVASDLVDACAAAGVRLVRTYGSTETSGGCVYDGSPLDGVSLRIEAGEVQVGGATLADGYADASGVLTESAAFVEAGGIRWYRTGDLGELSPGGELRITGRADRVFISGGVNVSLDRLEQVLRAVPGLEHAVATAVPHERWGQVPAVVVAAVSAQRQHGAAPSGARAAESPAETEFEAAEHTREDALLAAARAAAELEIGPAAKPAVLHIIPALPLTPSGKTDYEQLARVVGSV